MRAHNALSVYKRARSVEGSSLDVCPRHPRLVPLWHGPRAGALRRSFVIDGRLYCVAAPCCLQRVAVLNESEAERCLPCYVLAIAYFESRPERGVALRRFVFYNRILYYNTRRSTKAYTFVWKSVSPASGSAPRSRLIAAPSRLVAHHDESQHHRHEAR